MPSEYEQNIRRMKQTAIVSLVCVCGSVLSLCIGIAVAFWKEQVLWGVAAAVIAAVFVAVMILLEKRFKAETRRDTLYRIDTDVDQLDLILQRLQAVPVIPDAYVAFHSHNKMKIRTIVSFTLDYDSKEIKQHRKKVNREINRVYGVKSKMPLYEALSMLRINLVVCPTGGNAVSEWVSRNADSLLYRNEAIIHAAIILEEKKLLIPAVLASLDLGQLHTYQTAISYLLSMFQHAEE